MDLSSACQQKSRRTICHSDPHNVVLVELMCSEPAGHDNDCYDSTFGKAWCADDPEPEPVQKMSPKLEFWMGLG
jgi:hypothetical protein